MNMLNKMTFCTCLAAAAATTNKQEDDNMTEKINRDEIYKKIAKVQSKTKKKPRKLESKDGVFLLNPKNKHDRSWFEEDELGDNDK